ncbi:hypothetical protein J3R82DRAFT_10499 [Butyriboletus roseoflavus]|nr:hypothetical protein J3R82DRAFT_10499 [Butyriboletus roseoflavus]
MSDANSGVPPPSLQERIQTLTDIHNRLQTLRHVPTVLLRPPSASPLADFPPPFDPTIDREFAVTFNSTPSHDFRALNDFLEVLRSDKVQEGLRAARASEDADQSELGLCFVRENRKRKHPQSPVGSPQPYVPQPPRSSSLFASAEDDPPPMRAESLLEFVREFNRGNVGEVKSSTGACKLAIWSRTKAIRDELKAASSRNANGGAHAGRLTSPVVLRFMIPDVLVAYISLIFTELESPLVVESVAAFGPRERKLPHEQSDYLAFQGLSQHITKMVLSHPRVPVQILMVRNVRGWGIVTDLGLVERSRLVPRAVCGPLPEL